MSKKKKETKEKINKNKDNLSIALRKNLQRRKAAKNIKSYEEEDIGELFIGYMSGTSCDGIDASLIRTDGQSKFAMIANAHMSYPLEFKADLKKLCAQLSPFLEIEKKLTEFHIQITSQLLKQTKYSSNDIKAVGFHGQTVFHNPQSKVTLQIGNPHLLAQGIGIDVVHDFRRRDMSLGGQGAPLVPIFHKLLVQHKKLPVAVINIGGVANITYISEKGDIIAFDTGPGCALIDDAMNKYFSKSYDEDGETASKGKVNELIVSKFLVDKYFKQPYPKSLDRNAFKYVMEILATHDPKDIIATLTYITCATIVCAIEILPSLPVSISLCGGGSKNKQIVKWIESILLMKALVCKVENISSIDNLDPNYIESQAFAYLTARFFKNLPSAFPTTTAAASENICGCLVRK